MSRNTLLLATFCHAPHVIHNLTEGEMLRTKRNCSISEHLPEYHKQVVDKLLARQYPSWSINRALNKTALMPWESLFNRPSKTDKSGKKEESVTFTTPYSRQFKQITSIVQKHLPLLTAQEGLRDTVEKNIHFFSTKAPTLGSMLPPSLFSSSVRRENWLSTRGFCNCGHNICTACHYVNRGDTFCSSSKGSQHSIKSMINCNTRFVVYLITCIGCDIQ